MGDEGGVDGSLIFCVMSGRDGDGDGGCGCGSAQSKKLNGTFGHVNTH